MSTWESSSSLKALFRILWRFHDDFSEPVLKARWIKCRLHDPMSMSDEGLFFWHSFCTSESNFKLVFGPSIEIWIIFVSSMNSPLWNAATRSSLKYDLETKMSSTAQWPCFHPHSNIAHECPFHFSVCFRSETRRIRLI